MSALVYTPVATRKDARSLATRLLDEKLVACANILGEVKSLYDCDGERGEGREVGILFKTDAALLDRAVARIEELHPYETPAVLGWRCDAPGEATRAWLGKLAL